MRSFHDRRRLRILYPGLVSDFDLASRVFDQRIVYGETLGKLVCEKVLGKICRIIRVILLETVDPSSFHINDAPDTQIAYFGKTALSSNISSDFSSLSYDLNH